MIGAADYRLVFRRKAGNDERQNVSYGSLADIVTSPCNVRFTPESGHAVRRQKESAMCHKRILTSFIQLPRRRAVGMVPGL
jgi:hypothetical protein